MAKADSTGTRGNEDVMAKVAREIREIARDMDFVHCTALCVQLALLHQRADNDIDIARCVYRHISNELVRLGDMANGILKALGAEPYRSPLFWSGQDDEEEDAEDDE